MKKCKKLVAIFMVSVFSLSTLTLTAGAVEGEGDAGGDAGAVVDDPISADPVTPESDYGDSSSYSDGGGGDSYSSADGGSSYYGGGDSYYSSSSAQSYDSQSSYSDYNNYNDYSSSYNNDSYYSSSSSYSSYYGGYEDSYDSYSNQNGGSDDSQSYNGSDQSSEASLIESESNVDEDTLSSSDWSDIAKSLSSASASTDGSSSDGDDFNFIKNNTSTGDNGQWMFYVALSMIMLSILGITYFVGSTVLSRKKSAGRAKAAAVSRGSYPQQRTRSSYDDGYSESPKKHGKYDTAEIRLPKNGPSGGRRYRE